MLPVVPMFHINGWCVPYGCLIAGAKLVLPGPRLDGAGLYELMETEQVTMSAGVPTVWLQLLQYADQHRLRFSSLKRVVSGGSAVPPALIAKFDERFGIEVRQGWGMTETTAAATMGCLNDAQLQRSTPHGGTPLPPIAASPCSASKSRWWTKTVATLPRDGRSQGELMVRGQWIVSGYYKSETSPLKDGWFPTGDIATIDRSRRLADPRPRQGSHQDRRRMDQLDRPGKYRHRASRQWRRRPSSASSIRSGRSARCCSWSESPGTVSRPGIFCRISPSGWRNGGCLSRSSFSDSLPVGGTGKVQKTHLREKYGDVFD